jgi:hypothetical protein
MKAASYEIPESNPFADRALFAPPAAAAHPIAGRLKAIWESMRRRVIHALPRPPYLPQDRKAYLRLVDDIYQSDAYHSPSIEGYSISMELTERVRAGNISYLGFDCGERCITQRVLLRHINTTSAQEKPKP